MNPSRDLCNRAVLRGKTGDDAQVILSTITQPYPTKNQKFNDEAKNDKGSNFGRVARGGLMSEFNAALLEQPISGIPAVFWQSFLKIFSEGVNADTVQRSLEKMRKDAEAVGLSVDGLEAFDRVQEALRDLISKC